MKSSALSVRNGALGSYSRVLLFTKYQAQKAQVGASLVIGFFLKRNYWIIFFKKKILLYIMNWLNPKQYLLLHTH